LELKSKGLDSEQCRGQQSSTLGGGGGDTVEISAAQEQVVTKRVSDEHSLQARWMTLPEFETLDKPRGPELLDWGGEIEQGECQIFPLASLQEVRNAKHARRGYLQIHPMASEK
jgi:hypothetical protein